MSLIDELGQLYGPIALTGTGNLSLVHQALIDWAVRSGKLSGDELIMRLLPVVGETLDIRLNDVFGHPMTEADVFSRSGWRHWRPAGSAARCRWGHRHGRLPVQRGIGTASRVMCSSRDPLHRSVCCYRPITDGKDLRIAGIPIGEEIPDLLPQSGQCGADNSTCRGADDPWGRARKKLTAGRDRDRCTTRLSPVGPACAAQAALGARAHRRCSANDFSGRVRACVLNRHHFPVGHGAAIGGIRF